MCVFWLPRQIGSNWVFPYKIIDDFRDRNPRYFNPLRINSFIMENIDYGFD